MSGLPAGKNPPRGFVARARRKLGGIWHHRWPQLCWWARFLSGVSLLERARQSVAWVPAGDGPGSAEPPSCHVLPGAIHVHTTYSDGLGSVPQVAAAAAEAGLGFVVITDHQTMQPLADGWEGYHSGCLVLIGTENRVHEGHVLALNVPATFTPQFIAAGAALEAIRAAGGVAFFLPDEDARFSTLKIRHLPFAGMEVINLHNLARQFASLPNLLVFAFRYATGGPMSALKLLAARPGGEMLLWDRLAGERPTPGIASVDAHSRIRISARRDLRLPTYLQSFRLVQTHLLLAAPLTGEVAADRQQVYEALTAGRSHLVYGACPGGERVRFWATAAGEAVQAGGALREAAGLQFHARSPGARSVFRLLRNGRCLAQREGEAASFAPGGPGVYRLEVYRAGVRLGPARFGLTPWVFTNPIVVQPQEHA